MKLEIATIIWLSFQKTFYNKYAGDDLERKRGNEMARQVFSARSAWKQLKTSKEIFEVLANICCCEL